MELLNAYKTLVDALGGAKTVGPELELTAIRLLDRLNPNCNLALKLGEAQKIKRLAGQNTHRPDVVSALEEVLRLEVAHTGYMHLRVPPPAPTGNNLRDIFLLAAKEAGDVSASLLAALADDIITLTENAGINREIDQAVSALLALLIATDQVAVPDKQARKPRAG